MPKLTVSAGTLTNPRWPGGTLKPGVITTLQVDAPQIKPDQYIEFRIRQGEFLVDAVKGAAGATSATWKAPNLPHDPTLFFDAVLTSKPSPKSGFQAVVAKATSAGALLQGFAVSIDTVDAAFAPHAEKLEVAYEVWDPGGVVTNGRYEIWGERYPGNQPLYTENFTPAHGGKTWNTWDGKANAGTSSGKYISPEFSPYRVKVVIGLSQGAVDDVFGAGIGQAAAPERSFEVTFQSVSASLPAPANYTEAAAAAPATANYTLAQVLAIGRQPNGTYTAMGRLPDAAANETCRIRIPMACHQRKADALDQGTLAVRSATSNYFPAGGQAKHDIDALFYTRPEIPIEFKLKLTSRIGAKNATPDFGVYDALAVGPAKIEPYAEDTLVPAIHVGLTPNQTYWRKSAFKIKDGLHYAPVHSGAAGIAAAGVAANAPLYSYWEARFEIAADGQVDFDLDTFDPFDKTYRYQPGNGELTLFLNRTKLVLGASQAILDKNQADYIEVDFHTIKLRANFTKAHSAATPNVLWVMRSVPATGTVPNWSKFPPGSNCHTFYGGTRGSDPLNGLFKKTFSTPAGGKEPVIGKSSGAYPYAGNNFINLHPDPGVAATDDERVEISAIVAAGPQQGIAGVLFSPSVIAGDTYTIRAFVDAAPYERNLGCVEAKPAVEGKTGALQVWRVITISDSQRLPDPGTVGLSAGVGCPPEAAIGTRTYIGDGVNMNMTRMNTALERAFNEWIIAPPDARLPALDAHKNVNLDTYRAQYMAATFPGQVPMSTAAGNGNNGGVRNDLVPIDAYRILYPPGFPSNRVKIAAKVIAALPKGTSSAAAMAAVQTKLATVAPATGDDWFFGYGIPSIAESPASWGPLDYFWWVVGKLSPPKARILDAITPQSAQPKEVKVVRWPLQHESNLWDRGSAPMGSTGMTLQGEYIGNSQSDFITQNAPTLFQHEMGHSVHLVHFVGGNFGWKHHNILQADCMMSYNWPIGFVAAPAGRVGPTGAGTAFDQGWPHTVPNLPTLQGLKAAGHAYNIDPAADPDAGKNPGGAVAAAAAVGAPCIRLDAFGANPPPGGPCAKCVLKLRGWQELVLPVAWNHPDLY